MKKEGVMEPLIDEQYKEFVKLMPICCVDVIVHVGEAFLLLKRDREPAKGEWWFPGGRLFKGERLIDATIRKIKEEVNIEVVVERLVSVYETIFDTSHFGVSSHTINVIYSVTPVSSNFNGIELNYCHSEYKVIDDVVDCHPYIRRVISDWSNNEKSINYRN